MTKTRNTLDILLETSLAKRMIEKGQSAEENKGRTYDHLHKDMPISLPDLSDAQVADLVRMLMREDLYHEAVCVAARDRIKCLMKEKAALEQKVLELTANTVAQTKA